MDKKTLQAEIAQMKAVLNDADTDKETKEILSEAVKEAEKQLSEIEKSEKEVLTEEKKLVNTVKGIEKDMKVAAPAIKKELKKSLTKAKADLSKVKVKKQTVKKKVLNKVSEATKKARGILASLSKKQKDFNKGRSEDDLQRDAKRKAKPIGYRISKEGNRYYESRANRSDISRKKKPFLEHGGELSNTKEAVDLLWKGYAEAILFSENDVETEKPLDANYSISDFDEKTVSESKEMLEKFYLENKAAIIESGLDLETIGNNIWYARAGHGAGFFDYSLDMDVEKKLQNAARKLGRYAYVETYDGKIAVRGGRVFEDGGELYGKGGSVSNEEKYFHHMAMFLGTTGKEKEYHEKKASQYYSKMNDDERYDNDRHLKWLNKNVMIGDNLSLDERLQKYVEKNRSKHEDGGELGDEGLKYAILNHVSAGTVASITGLTKYKEIDGIKLRAVQILMRDGDKPYSMENLKQLLLEAKDEWVEDNYENGGSIKGRVLKDREILNSANQYKTEFQGTVLGFPSTWNKSSIDGSPVIYFSYLDDDFSGKFMVASGVLENGVIVNASDAGDSIFEHEIDALRYAHSIAKDENFDAEEFAFGGRLKSAIMRDRAYKSNEPHEQRYERKTRPKNPKYKYEEGGTIKEKSELGLGDGKNITVFGYDTKHFDLCPKAVEQYEKAINVLNLERDSSSALWKNQTESLAKSAEYADSILGQHKLFHNDNVPTEIEELTIDNIVSDLMMFATYNYKTGLLVNGDFLAFHVYKIIQKKKYELGGDVMLDMQNGGFDADPRFDINAPEFAKGGVVKQIPEGKESYYMGASHIEKEIMDKIRGQLSGLTFAGNFFMPEWKSSSDAYLYELDEFDKKYISGIKTKEGEKVFRYYTRTSAIGGMIPLVKINIDKGLVYFATYDNDGEVVGFDSKGTRALYINLVSNSNKFEDGGKAFDWSELFKPLSEEELEKFAKEQKESESEDLKRRKEAWKQRIRASGKDWNDAFLRRVKAVKHSISKFVDAYNSGNNVIAENYVTLIFDEIEAVKEMGFAATKYGNELEKKFRLLYDKTWVRGEKIYKYKKGGLVGGVEGLEDDMLRQKIEIFLGKMPKQSFLFYYVDKIRNSFFVGFNGELTQDEADFVYSCAISSREFFDADEVSMKYNSETNNTVFEIPVRRTIVYAGGGTITDRIQKMKEGWEQEGRAFSHVSKMKEDEAFFKSINVDPETVGITSQTGNDVVYYNADMYESDTDALRKKVKKFADGGKVPVDKKYTHFAVRKSDGKIVTGWDYKGVDKEDIATFSKMDLKDMDIEPKTVSIVTKTYLIGKGIDPFSWDNWRDPKEYYAHGGSTKSKCEKYVSEHESVMDNGYYFDFSTIKNFVDPYAQLPEIDMNFCMVTYNSGGQKGLKVTDTVNSVNLVKELSSELGIEKESAMMLLSVYLKKAHRLNSIEDLNGKKTIIVDRDKIVCSDLDLSGENYRVFYLKVYEDGEVGTTVFSKIIYANSEEEAVKEFFKIHPTYKVDNVSKEYANGGNVDFDDDNQHMGSVDEFYKWSRAHVAKKFKSSFIAGSPIAQWDKHEDGIIVKSASGELKNGKKVEYDNEEYKWVEVDEFAKGGSVIKKVKFSDKVKSIAASLVGKDVKPKYKKTYGKKYDPKEAKEAAKRIAGAMKAKEEKKK